MSKFQILLFALVCCFSTLDAFTVVPCSRVRAAQPRTFQNTATAVLRMSESESDKASATAATEDEEDDPMAEEMMDAETRLQMEKIRRSEELRAQEVFMQKSTGIHKCTNCDWEFDEEKGDSMMIGGMIKPGTKFEDLPNDWRCPVCRASKDSFTEVVVEIPGFEVNQGYGFGGNSMTADQKNLLIFGGLGAFFVLFLAGYGLS